MESHENLSNFIDCCIPSIFLLAWSSIADEAKEFEFVVVDSLVMDLLETENDYQSYPIYEFREKIQK